MILINAMNILNMIKSVVLLLTQAPVLFFKFFYLRHIGVKAFEYQLLKDGLDSRQAAILALSYKNMLPLKWKYFKEMNGKGGWNKVK